MSSTGVVGSGIAAGSVTPTADCTATLYPQQWRWTAQCVVTHTVTIKVESWWYYFDRPWQTYYTTTNHSREVVPGTPWNGALYTYPERRVTQMCLTAYQDTTLQIAPRSCASWPTSSSTLT